jgi:hypothetical protein
MLCPECSANIPAHSSSCPACGASIANANRFDTGRDEDAGEAPTVPAESSSVAIGPVETTTMAERPPAPQGSPSVSRDSVPLPPLPQTPPSTAPPHGAQSGEQEIPARQYGPALLTETATRRRGRGALFAAAAIFFVALGTVIGAVATSGDSRDRTASSNFSRSTAVPSSTRAVSAAASASSSTVSPSLTTVTTRVVAVPAGDGPPYGTWITQLESVEIAAGQSQLEAVLATVLPSVPEALVLDSGNYGSLRPGYWVIYHPGPFVDGYEAMALCDARGRAMPSKCLGRLLTPDPEDVLSSQCYRQATGSLTEGCSR